MLAKLAMQTTQYTAVARREWGRWGPSMGVIEGGS
jgi:hypothetical protein